MPSKLDQLRTMTIVVADTGDIDAVRRLKPVDCTTNPTLILKAIADPLLAETFDEALSWGRRQAGGHEEIVSAVADRIAVSVGAALSQLVPGRVSTEVDADLSFDTNATVAKSRSVIEAYRARGIGRERVLVKIAATWEGIRAAEVLQRDEIDCNLTLIFNKAQAIACADAGVFLISPFVGRIYDWHVKNAGRTFEPEEDPGVQSVRTIYDYFKSHGVQTVVMGASFRSQGQIEALAGCDRLTISPALLDKLAVDDGRLERKLHAEPRRSAERIAMDERTFRRMMGEDPMATECLDRGIRSFDEDLKRLRAMIAARLTEAAPSSLVEA